MRLDLYLVEKGLAASRTRAANLIKLGGVTVDGKVVDKPAYEVASDDEVVFNDVIGFASLGGLKLEEAITRLSVPVRGVAVDIGASNGGFTDCLLRHGASHVYAVDVGECALPPELANDSRVTVMDNTNARTLTPADFPGALDMAVCDVSFISITLILPVIASLLKAGGHAVVLVKPQFEVGRKGLTKSGLVKDDKTRLLALKSVKACAESVGLKVAGECEVPKLFADKNVEYLLHLTK